MENTSSSETKSLVVVVDGLASESAEPSTTDAGVKKQKLCVWQRGIAGLAAEPLGWVGMLSRELGASFVLAVALVYGVSKGFGDAVFHVASDYYWKEDARKMQPAAVQVFLGLYDIPWILKPVWGVLTDTVPICGYRRRPYFIIAGIVGATSTAVCLVVDRPSGGARAALPRRRDGERRSPSGS